MEPKFEPKQYTPEEIAQLEKSRTISDAELLKGGAEYSINEKGEKENLLATDEQKYEVNGNQGRLERLLSMIKESGIHHGDRITVDTPGSLFNANYRGVDTGNMILIVSHGNLDDSQVFKIPLSRVVSVEQGETEGLKDVDERGVVF